MSLQLKSLLVVVQNLNLDDLTVLKQEVDKQQEHKKLEWVYSLIPSITSAFDVKISIERNVWLELVIQSKEGLVIRIEKSPGFASSCRNYYMRYTYTEGSYFMTWELPDHRTKNVIENSLLTCPLGVTMDMIEELEYIRKFFTF